MRKLQIIGLISFIIGLIIKLPHIPGTSLLLMIGTLLLVIDSLVFLFKNVKQNIADTFLNLTFTFWTIYLLCRIQYWSCGPSIIGFSLLYFVSTVLTIIYFVLHFRNLKRIKTPQILLITYFVFSFWLSFVHSYRIFYFFNLNEVFEKNNRIENYKAWDKYSWFLYVVDKQDEAIEANQNAQRIIGEKLKTSQDNDLIKSSEIIKNHGQLIRDKNWNDFE